MINNGLKLWCSGIPFMLSCVMPACDVIVFMISQMLPPVAAIVTIVINICWWSWALLCCVLETSQCIFKKQQGERTKIQILCFTFTSHSICKKSRYYEMWKEQIYSELAKIWINTWASGWFWRFSAKKTPKRTWLCRWISPLLFALATRRNCQNTRPV